MSEHDRSSLAGVLRDHLGVAYADAEALAAAVARRVPAASDREWLLAALELLREQAAALRKARAATDPR